MLLLYQFDKFKLGLEIPNLASPNQEFVDKFQILNFSMSSVVSPEINEIDKIFTLKQVHGNEVVSIENNKILFKEKIYDFSYSLSGTIEADAIVTVDRGIKVGIRSADCAPIMFFGNGVVGGIHGGWRGLKEGIIENTINFVRKKYGFEPQKALYFLLPCIHSCCYEVGEEFLEWAKNFCLIRGGKVYFDIPKFVLSKLLELEASEENIYYSPLCTKCNSEFLPSYRSTKTEDRIEAFIYLT
ncbi:MAG: polyphenol oxidase family protein [Brevinematia bacterium]